MKFNKTTTYNTIFYNFFKEENMKTFKKFHFFYVFTIAIILLGLSLGQAAALTPEQEAQIQAAVAAGDLVNIENTIMAMVEDAIINGEDPALASQQATSIAVTAAASVGEDYISAVAQAASKGATQGAVEAALATDQDVAAVAQAASSGATQGAVEAAGATGQEAAVVDAVIAAAGTGATEGAVEAATNNDLGAAVIADVTQATQTGSTQGLQQIAGATTPGAPEAFEPADEEAPPATPPGTPPVVETPVTQDGAASPT